MNYNQTEYLTSSTGMSNLPEDTGVEIAFVGRSNAGKSSAMNKITRKKKLAKISKTPGRTQMINLFKITDDCRFADLPGYGYAKVSKSMQANWGEMIKTYLEKRECLRGLVLIMDIRHPLKETDCNLINSAIAYNLPVHILLTKADKLSLGVAKETLKKVQEKLIEYDNISVQLFSSVKDMGLEEVKTLLTDWFLNN